MVTPRGPSDDAGKSERSAGLSARTEFVQSRFGELPEAVPDAVVVVDQEGQIVLVNQQAEQMFGYVRDELIGQRLEVLLPERFRSIHVQHRGHYCAEPHTRSMGVGLDLFGLRKDGTEVPVEISLSPLPTEQGLFAVSAIRDITERKQIERERRQTEERFHLLVDAVTDYAIFMLDPSGNITTWNHGAERIKGYSAPEVVGRHFSIFYPAEDVQRGKPEQALAIAASEGRFEDEGWRVRKNGSRFWAHVVLTAIRDDSGQLLGFGKVSHDETERRETAERLAKQATDLERSNQDLQQFAYVASHDLQEPLRMVASYTQLLSRRYQGRLDADADEFIGFAVDGARRMQALINDLLSYSRVGSRIQEFSVTDLNQVLDRVLRDLGPSIADAGATITRDHLPSIAVDAVQIVPLFQNLVANAIKFRGQEVPVIHVGARYVNAVWLFSVRDNGIGLDPQYADRIFVIFQRLHGHRDYPGTGIGLAICQKIVERHGGRIWVESQPGAGTTFYFTLPDREASIGA